MTNRLLYSNILLNINAENKTSIRGQARESYSSRRSTETSKGRSKKGTQYSKSTSDDERNSRTISPRKGQCNRCRFNIRSLQEHLFQSKRRKTSIKERLILYLFFTINTIRNLHIKPQYLLIQECIA